MSWKTGDSIRRALVFKIVETTVNILLDREEEDNSGKIAELFQLQKKMHNLGLFDEESEYEFEEWVGDFIKVLEGGEKWKKVRKI